MWESSIGMLLILAITLVLGALFGPAKRKPRASFHRDSKIVVHNIESRVLMAGAQQASLGAASSILFSPPVNNSSAQTANSAASGIQRK